MTLWCNGKSNLELDRTGLSGSPVFKSGTNRFICQFFIWSTIGALKYSFERLFVAFGIKRHVQELTHNYPFAGSFWENGSKLVLNYIWTSRARVRTLHILTFTEPNTKHYLTNIINNRVLIRWLTWTVESEPSLSSFPHYFSRKNYLRLSLEYFLSKMSEEADMPCY